MTKTIPNKVGTILKVSEADHYDLMLPRIFAGQSNFGRILKSPTLLTRSKALVKSISEMYIFHVIVWWIISNQ